MPEDLSQFKHRVWTFDYLGGLWTINGQTFGDGTRCQIGEQRRDLIEAGRVVHLDVTKSAFGQ